MVNNGISNNKCVEPGPTRRGLSKKHWESAMFESTFITLWLLFYFIVILHFILK